MAGTNNANINVNLNVDKAIGNATKLKSSMQRIGSTSTAMGAKVQASSAIMGTGMNAVGASMTGVTAKAARMTSTVTTGFNTMGNSAVQMGQRVQSGAAGASNGLQNVGKSAQGASRNIGVAAIGAAGLAASITALYTSFSSLTSFEIKLRKAQLGVQKGLDLIATTEYGLANQRKAGNEAGILLYEQKLATAMEDYSIKVDKAKLAEEEFGDANANFATGILTSGINIGIMSGLLLTNIGITKASVLSRLGLDKANKKEIASNILSNKTTAVGTKINKASIVTNRIKLGGIISTTGMMTGGTIATGSNAAANVVRTGTIVTETGATWASNAAHTVRNALMGPVGIAILVAAAAAIGTYAYMMHAESESIEENTDIMKVNQEAATEQGKIMVEVEAEIAELTATTNGLTTSNDDLTTSLTNTKTASQLWYEEMKMINTEARAAAAGVVVVNEVLDEFSKKNQVLGDISGLNADQVGQKLIDAQLKYVTGARGASKNNSNSILKGYGFGSAGDLGLDFITENNKRDLQDKLDLLGPIFDGKTFSGYATYLTELGMTDTRDKESEIKALLYDKNIVANGIKYWLKTTNHNDPQSFMATIRKYMRDNRIRTKDQGYVMYREFGFSNFDEIQSLWNQVQMEVTGGQNRFQEDRFRIVTELYELGEYSIDEAAQHLAELGASGQKISKWKGMIRQDKKNASGYYGTGVVSGTGWDLSNWSPEQIAQLSGHDKMVKLAGGHAYDSNIYVIGDKVFSKVEFDSMNQGQRDKIKKDYYARNGLSPTGNLMGGTGPALGASGMIGVGSTGSTIRNNVGTQHGGVNWAGKSAWIAKLQKKDDIENALRKAGLGFGAMSLTDGSFIRTIRGHLTGKRTIDERPQGFKNGKTLLDESYWGQGAAAWQKLSSKVNAISERGSSRMVEQFRAARLEYQTELEMIIKRMFDQRDKDKEMKDAEIARLKANDGSKAKEFFNKAHTNDAYEIYDDINYRDYKTQIAGGLTANV